jgi:hypothetical protein
MVKPSNAAPPASGLLDPDRTGEPTQIKIDTFFTKDDLLHGEVLSLSQDAIARDTPQTTFKATRRAKPLGATAASPRARSWSTPPASPSIARRCGSRTNS